MALYCLVYLGTFMMTINYAYDNYRQKTDYDYYINIFSHTVINPFF